MCHTVKVRTILFIPKFYITGISELLNFNLCLVELVPEPILFVLLLRVQCMICKKKKKNVTFVSVTLAISLSPVFLHTFQKLQEVSFYFWD